MGLAFYKKLFINYQNASLPLKISVPFIVTFLGFWVGSTMALGFMFANQLEREQQEQSVELMALVKQEIDEELNFLQKEARLLSLEEQIIQATINENRNQLQQSILTLSSTLDVNIISVINRDKQELFELQTLPLHNGSIQTQAVRERLAIGSEISTIIGSSPLGPPILISTALIKNERGFIGGVILGIALDNQLLRKVNQSVKEQIVVLGEGGIVASTLPPDFNNKRLEELALNKLKPVTT